MKTETVSLTVNDKVFEFVVGNKFGQIQQNETLLWTLRERLRLTGAKRGCEEGACGCCTVIIDNKAITSCMVLTAECDGKAIKTIEGLADPLTGALSPLQQAFIDFYAFQCGYCTPGIIMTAKALLDANPHPTAWEIEEALSGNHCRCISQYHVLDAIKHVAKQGVR